MWEACQRATSSRDAVESKNHVLVTSQHSLGSVIKSEKNCWHRQSRASGRNASESEEGGGLVEQEGTLPRALALPLTSSAFLGKAVLVALWATGLLMKGELDEIVWRLKG